MSQLIRFALSMLVLFGGLNNASAQVEESSSVKAKVTSLIAQQRSDAVWMSMTSCPADLVPAKSDVAKQPSTAEQCADDPSKCLSACNSGEGRSCQALAYLIQNHEKIESDVSQVLFRRACQFGIPSGCTNAATELLGTFEESPKLLCAARSFEVACAYNDPWGCTMSGMMLSGGYGREKNRKEAIRVLNKACQISMDKKFEACTRAKELRAMLTKEEKKVGRAKRKN